MNPETPTRQHRPARPAHPKLRALLSLARSALLWERLWPALWPAFGVLCLFLALGLLDILPTLPPWLHALVLVALLAGLAWGVRQGIKRIHMPSLDQARRRLERDSGLDHRPLATLDDTLVAGAADRDSAAVWSLHQTRMRERLRRLRVGLPHAGLAKVDPYGIRAALGLLLVIGVVTGYGDIPERLGRALLPDFTAMADSRPTGLDVWINPPAYTGIAPMFLDHAKTDAATPLAVPVGSTVLAQVQGGRGTPNLVVGKTVTAFNPVTVDAYKISAKIDQGDRLAVEQNGRTLVSWPLSITPDKVPTVEFLSAPGRSERAALRLEYRAEDDYGLTRVTGIIHRIDKPDLPPIEIELPLPGIDLRNAESLSFHDLTPHPWAGLAVEIKLVAEDAIGQRGESDGVRTVLPERIFNHPVARALVELRKQLSLHPEARLPVVRALSEIYDRPDHYFNDIVVALALRSAERRLIHDPSDEAIGEVQQLLWDTALHIEEGELAIAERDLRDIQKKLMDALAKGADDAEIERLMEEMRKALDQFLEAMSEQLREQMAKGEEPQPLSPDTQLLQGDDLRSMLDRAQELARSGARDAARDLLAQLQNMLENLRANPFAQGMNNQARNAMRMMQDMESMMKRQQELLNRSFQRAQRSRPKGGNSTEMQSENQGDARAQEKLRRDLGDMMRQLGETLGDIPGPLGRAERAMRDARDALAGNQSGDAVGPQTRALDQLQQGMQAMADQFMQQMGAGAPPGMGRLGAQPGQGQDPLGRRAGSSGYEALEGVKIPDQMEMRRSREILDELRRRRGERRRPPVELDYLDRLLKQF